MTTARCLKCNRWWTHTCPPNLHIITLWCPMCIAEVPAACGGYLGAGTYCSRNSAHDGECF